MPTRPDASDVILEEEKGFKAAGNFGGNKSLTGAGPSGCGNRIGGRAKRVGLGPSLEAVLLAILRVAAATAADNISVIKNNLLIGATKQQLRTYEHNRQNIKQEWKYQVKWYVIAQEC